MLFKHVGSLIINYFSQSDPGHQSDTVQDVTWDLNPFLNLKTLQWVCALGLWPTTKFQFWDSKRKSLSAPALR